MPLKPTRHRNVLALALPYVGVGVLLLLAVLGKSAVMAASAGGIGLALWLARAASLRQRIATAVGGALIASVAAETVHTMYHLLGGETASGDDGFFFVSAVLVGAINAAAICVVLWAAHLLLPSERSA